MITSADELLTGSEVMARLKIGRTTVYTILDSGQLRGVKLGNSRRVLVRDMQGYSAQGFEENEGDSNHTKELIELGSDEWIF